MRAPIAARQPPFARLDLARKRVVQNRELATSGAGNRFDLEQAETSLAEAQNQLAAANSHLRVEQVDVHAGGNANNAAILSIVSCSVGVTVLAAAATALAMSTYQPAT